MYDFEQVRWEWGGERCARLRNLPPGEVSKSTTARVRSLSHKSATVRLLQQAMYQCANEGYAQHGGSLHVLFFASYRLTGAQAKPDSLRDRTAEFQATRAASSGTTD